MCVDTKDGSEYYEVVVSVVELVYATGMPVVLLKCRWFNEPNIPRSTKMDHGLLSVNTCTSWYENQPFIVATMARLVFYLDDLKEGGGWKVVNVMSDRGIYSATTLEMGIANRDIENVTLEPYQEASTFNILDTETIHINNDIHFQPREILFLPASSRGPEPGRGREPGRVPKSPVRESSWVGSYSIDAENRVLEAWCQIPKSPREGREVTGVKFRV
ncbi:hypothetical protein ACLB2K_029028 [Fragaria x ananassa]